MPKLGQEVTICEQQYGFMTRKSNIDTIFAFKLLTEKYREGQKEPHCVFVDLGKHIDWCCMRQCEAVGLYVRLVQDM